MIEGHKSRMFENWVLKRIFGPERKYQEDGQHCRMGHFMICSLDKV
jgi:hypothetical protein